MRAVLAAIAAASAAAPVHWWGFATPSRNIVCNSRSAGRPGIDCVVFSASPACQRTWSLNAAGSASVRLRCANIGTEVKALPYGRTWTRQGIRCVSRRAGLTCANRSGHGFFLSRERQRRF